jgi:hypothetical protein
MVDVEARRWPHNLAMRRLLVLTLAAALGSWGCAPSAVAPPGEPAATPAAVAPSASPASDQPSPTPPAQPTEPVNVPAPPQVPFPTVALLSQAFTVGALPAPAAATAAEDLQSTQQSLEVWTPMFAEMLTRYQGLYAGDAAKQLELRAGLDAMVAPGPFAEVLKIWALRDTKDGRTFTTSDARILKVYAKPWGRASYADIGFKLIEAGGPNDTTRDLRLRVTVGRSWRAIDAWDEATARWLVGETPQYSALALESEVPSAVANYLYNESFVPGGPEQFAQRPPELSQFMRARFDALNELNSAFKEGRLVDRHFEGPTVKILRFDPATYLGDGVLTVLVSGKLVQTDGAGTTRTFPFSQQMKILRSLRGGSPNLNAVDQQSTNGTWDSGGELALYAVDIEFG